MQYYLYSFVLVAVLVYIGYSVRTSRLHKQRMLAQFTYRIHVNGIRGKSSVTRLIAGALREGDIKTLAKTTGTAARIITSHKREKPIVRLEADIAEQRRTLKKFFNKGYEAIVFECMAINPVYQKYLEHKVMYSNIGVITNVREDHMDMMGETLAEIAKSLSSTVPRNGHLITAEDNPELLAIIDAICKKRNTVLHAVASKRVSKKYMNQFGHYEYATNVAIALEVAKIVGIDRKTALNGMFKALPDPGAFVLRKFEQGDKTVHWANLFAINDRESFTMTAGALIERVGNKTTRAVILNNRKDRPERVSQFIDIAVNSLDVDYIFTFGDYENQVAKEVSKRYATKSIQVIHLGNSTKYKDAAGRILFKKITESIDVRECLLLGAVNIHTAQSQALLGRLEKKVGHHA